MRIGLARRLLDLMQGQRWLMAVSSSCRVVNQALGVLIPTLAAGFVVGVAEGSAPGLGSIIWILVSLALAKGLFRYLEQFTGHAVAFRLLAELRNRVYRWLERLEPAVLEGQRSGDLVARVSSDISRVEPFYAHTIAPAVAAVIVPAVSVIGVGVVAGWPPALVLAGFVILYLSIIPWIGSRRIGRVGPEVRRLAGESAAGVGDIVQGAREIAVLGSGQTIRKNNWPEVLPVGRLPAA
jgi:ATP-binding cassette subfamily C protein CydC